MSFKQIRKPIIGVTLAAATMFGASCSGEITSDTHQSQNAQATESVPSYGTMINFEDCVAEHSKDSYQYNDVVGSFGAEMAGQITVATCAAIESCPEDNSPNEILSQAVASGSTHSSEARAVLADQSLKGLVDIDELRNCIDTRVYDHHGLDEFKVIGQEPIWFLNRYPTTPDMPIAPHE